MKNIGGVLDYAVLSQRHRPVDQQQLAAEVRRLAGQGLTSADISTALRIDLAMVRTLLAASPAESAEIHRQHADAVRGARDGK